MTDHKKQTVTCSVCRQRYCTVCCTEIIEDAEGEPVGEHAACPICKSVHVVEQD